VECDPSRMCDLVVGLRFEPRPVADKSTRFHMCPCQSWLELGEGIGDRYHLRQSENDAGRKWCPFGD
jgi:hypothetical protein